MGFYGLGISDFYFFCVFKVERDVRDNFYVIIDFFTFLYLIFDINIFDTVD